MPKEIIRNDGSLPFSKAVIHDFKHVMEISGQVGLDSETGKLAENISIQTVMALENIKRILEQVGWGFENIVKVRIFLADMKDYAEVNEVYSKYFAGDYPSRVVLAVKALPLNALIEIECTAAGNEIKSRLFDTINIRRAQQNFS